MWVKCWEQNTINWATLRERSRRRIIIMMLVYVKTKDDNDININEGVTNFPYCI